MRGKRRWLPLLLAGLLWAGVGGAKAATLPAHDLYDEDFAELGSLYSVDPVFAKAVAVLETGWFRSRLCRVQNNLFGIRGRKGYGSFSSPQASIEYFMDLMNSPLYRDKSLEEIGKVYCPGSKSWASDVKKIMAMLKEEK